MRARRRILRLLNTGARVHGCRRRPRGPISLPIPRLLLLLVKLLLLELPPVRLLLRLLRVLRLITLAVGRGLRVEAGLLEAAGGEGVRAGRRLRGLRQGGIPAVRRHLAHLGLRCLVRWAGGLLLEHKEEDEQTN
jgi:hypothetical protein